MALGATLALGSACHKRAAPAPVLPNLAMAPRSATDAVVARVDGSPIYQSDVQRQAGTERVSAAEALQTLITLESLAQRALAHRLGAGAEAKEGWRQILVQAYVEREIEPQLTFDKIPDAAIKQVYERTKDGFMHSRLVRIAILDLYAYAGRDPERRRQAAAWAPELASDLKRNATVEDLKALSQQPKWVERGLKYGVAWQSDKQPYSDSVAKAVMALRNWGETTPVVEDAAGFHLAMYIGERAANEQSFEAAKADLRTAIFSLWQQRRFNEITQELARQAQVTVTPEALLRQPVK